MMNPKNFLIAAVAMTVIGAGCHAGVDFRPHDTSLKKQG